MKKNRTKLKDLLNESVLGEGMTSSLTSTSQETEKLIRVFLKKYGIKHRKKTEDGDVEIYFDYKTFPKTKEFGKGLNTLVKKLIKMDDWAGRDDVLYLGGPQKNYLGESVLGELPSSQMFKYNKATGKYEAPGSHSTNEEIEDQLAERMNEANIGSKKNDFFARGLNANIQITNQPNADISEKIYEEMIKFMKKHRISPNEIIFKF